MDDRRARILEATARCIARRGVRGLRIQEVAKEAGVSPGLLYYHFDNRANLLVAALAFIGDRAARYAGDGDDPDPIARTRHALLEEFQDAPTVIENSSAWGELRASALFEPELRTPLATATEEWNATTSGRIADAQRRGMVRADLDPDAAAATLTALVEGLSNRWLSGTLELADARRLLDDAVARLLLG